MTDKNILQFIKQLKEAGDGIKIGTPEFDDLCSSLAKGYQQNNKSKYYISIDLVQDDLKQFYSSTNEKYAYSELRNFFRNNSFEIRKDTNYLSRHYMTKNQINSLINSLNSSFPWLVVCASKIDVTEMKEVRVFDALKNITKVATADKTLDEIENELKRKVLYKEKHKNTDFKTEKDDSFER